MLCYDPATQPSSKPLPLLGSQHLSPEADTSGPLLHLQHLQGCWGPLLISLPHGTVVVRADSQKCWGGQKGQLAVCVSWGGSQLDEEEGGEGEGRGGVSLSPWTVLVTTCRTGPRSWMCPGSSRTRGLPPEFTLTSWKSEPLVKDWDGLWSSISLFPWTTLWMASGSPPNEEGYTACPRHLH